MAGGVVVGVGVHLHGGHDHGIHAVTDKGIRQGDGVHGGGQHTHVIRAGSLHLDRARSAAPDVTRAHHDADLNPRGQALLQHGGDLVDECKIQDGVLLSVGQGLTRKLEENSAIFRLLIHGTSPHFVDSYHYTINLYKCIQVFCEHSVFLRIFYEITAHSVTVKVISKA